MSPEQLFERARRALRQQLEGWRRAGVQTIARPPRSVEPLRRLPAAAAPAATSPSALDRVSSPEAVSLPQPQPVAQGARVAPPPVAPVVPEMPPASPAAVIDAYLSKEPLVAKANRSASKPSIEPARGKSDDLLPTLPPAERQKQLRVLQKEVERCTRCDELACSRTQTVFGVGNPAARLCFLGEAPGADEDRQGEPFVGRAGQLLSKIIEACTLQREDVYILNVLKCRPPGNRTPSLDEAEACWPFLERQLEIIYPEFICCLGAVAAQRLLNTKVSIGKLRGRVHQWRWAKVIVTYHPAYLLRNPSAKKDTWDDMKMLLNEMGISIPARNEK